MSAKSMIWLFVFLGSTIGSAVPVLFGIGWFSLWSIFFSTVGGLVGIWVGYKLFVV